jgi:hypothetical protein
MLLAETEVTAVTVGDGVKNGLKMNKTKYGIQQKAKATRTDAKTTIAFRSVTTGCRLLLVVLLQRCTVAVDIVVRLRVTCFRRFSTSVAGDCSPTDVGP